MDVLIEPVVDAVGDRLVGEASPDANDHGQAENEHECHVGIEPT